LTSIQNGCGNEASDGFAAPLEKFRPVWKPETAASSRHRYWLCSLIRGVDHAM
jgi:hypothetical protein